MASTKDHSGNREPDWRADGLSYHALNWHFRRTFGSRVWKISLDARFVCPNADGTAGRGGCIFCNIRSFSPSRRESIPSIAAQIDRAVERLRSKETDQFLAYFQPATNTYADLGRLRAVYQEALDHPQIRGLVVGTRPDCVPDEVLDLLAEFAAKTWLLVEYGLQSIHDRSLRWMNRGHDYAAMLDAVARSRRRGLRIGAHVILGIPGETAEDMQATAREIARLGLHSVKLHNLYAVKHTRLAEMVLDGSVQLPSREEYVGWVVDFLELLPPECVIDRLSGDAPREYLVAPTWCLDKAAVRQAIEAEFTRRGSWQGSRTHPASP